MPDAPLFSGHSVDQSTCSVIDDGTQHTNAMADDSHHER